MKSRELNEKIRHAWLLRTHSRLDECRALHAEARLIHARARGGTETDRATIELEIQLTLLEASFARFDGETEAFHSRIRRAESLCRAHAISLPFQYYFQKALFAFMHNDHAAALEADLGARATAREPYERAYALQGMLISLDNQGLPTERTLAELAQALADRGLDEASRTNLTQLDRSFRLRATFRAGRLAEVFATAPELPEGLAAGLTQAEYVRTWVSALPYHRFHDASVTRRLEEYHARDPFFFQKSFRLRTLQGVLHANDREQFQMTDVADRLYLWTWRWLARPENFPIERLMGLVGSLEPARIAPLLAVEDYLQIRNALLWISVFDPVSRQAIERIVRRLQMPLEAPMTSAYPLLEFEGLLLRQLLARRDRRDDEATALDRALREHPLAHSPDVGLASLLPGATVAAGPELASLHERLATLETRGAHAADATLTVDLGRHRITGSRRGGTIHSEPLCLAFDLMHRQGQVTCAQFALICFGISRFDPLIHNPKIFNLLARMKACAPATLRFGVKSGQVIARGDWHGVLVVAPDSGTCALQDQAEWRVLVTRSRPGRAARPEPRAPADRAGQGLGSLQQLGPGRDVSREDIERIMGKSRATANRLIVRWIAQGVLKKSGRARRTRYRILATPQA